MLPLPDVQPRSSDGVPCALVFGRGESLRCPQAVVRTEGRVWGAGVPHTFALVLSFCRGPWVSITPAAPGGAGCQPRGPAGSARAVRTGRLRRRQLRGRLCVGGHEFSLPPQSEGSCLPLPCPPRIPLPMIRGRSPQNGAWRAPQRTRTQEPVCRSLSLGERAEKPVFFSNA